MKPILLFCLGLAFLSSGMADTLWLSASDLTAVTPQIALIPAKRGVEANGSRILQLQSFVEGPYQAAFKFLIKQPGAYKLWVASTPQTAGWASPFLVLLDGKPLGDAADRTQPLEHQGPVYGLSNNPGLFQWYCFGKKDLKAGEHEVLFRVTTRRLAKDAGGQAFAFYLDSLLVTNDAALVPSGPGAKEQAEAK